MTDIKSYIESGILEKYVLGETDERETREVMDLSGKHPEILEEINKIEESLLLLAQSASVAPKANTKDKLMAELFGQNTESSMSHAEKPSNVVGFEPARTNHRWAIAASIALILSIGGNLYLFNQLKNSESAYLALVSEKQTLADNQKVLQADYQSAKSQLDVVTSESILPVKLNGINAQPDAKASVYYNTQSGEVYLHVAHVGDLPSDKQFQLWAIVDGKPVDAGVFDSKTGDVVIKMKNCNKPSAFAVTIEKSGGSPTPTLDQMVLMGALPS